MAKKYFLLNSPQISAFNHIDDKIGSYPVSDPWGRGNAPRMEKKYVKMAFSPKFEDMGTKESPIWKIFKSPSLPKGNFRQCLGA